MNLGPDKLMSKQDTIEYIDIDRAIRCNRSTRNHT
jgi:hypothetical protein